MRNKNKIEIEKEDKFQKKVYRKIRKKMIKNFGDIHTSTNN